MRENVNQAQYDQESYTSDKSEHDLRLHKKVDMNDLLARVKKEAELTKRTNIIIFSGVVFILSVSSLLIFI